MGIHEDLYAIFKNFDPDAFRAIHHEEFMVARELELSTLDDHCEIIYELAIKPDWDWHKKAEVVHENFYCIEWRWQDGDEIVTNVSLKKDGQLWRSVVNRIPISDTPPKFGE